MGIFFGAPNSGCQHTQRCGGGEEGGLRATDCDRTFGFIHENMQHLEESESSAEEPPHTYLYLIWKVPSRELFAARRRVALLPELWMNAGERASEPERRLRARLKRASTARKRLHVPNREREPASFWAIWESAALPAATKKGHFQISISMSMSACRLMKEVFHLRRIIF